MGPAAILSVEYSRVGGGCEKVLDFQFQIWYYKIDGGCSPFLLTYTTIPARIAAAEPPPFRVGAVWEG